MKVALTPHVFTQLTGKEVDEPKTLEDLETEWFGPPGSPGRIEADRDVARMRRRADLAARLTRWLRHVPVIGYLAAAFWFNILDEGVVATCKPRWGGLTFGFLNDGMKPTLWHTYQQVVHPHGKYDALYHGKRGAPRSRREADEWARVWADERRRREEEQTGI